MSIFHDDPTERGIILERTATHVAVSNTMDPAGSAIIVAMDQTSGVVINKTLSVVGKLMAPTCIPKHILTMRWQSGFIIWFFRNGGQTHIWIRH